MVSIHAPRVGRDDARFARLGCVRGFNSRAPRGARQVWHWRNGAREWFQFTRPAWGATICRACLAQGAGVSIHAPRVGRDPPHGCHLRRLDVSIHAPRVGRDARPHLPLCRYRRFNSRAPRGARPPDDSKSSRILRFQFTRPAWGATAPPGSGRQTISWFQFTRPAWGATRARGRAARRARFNSRAPRGARPRPSGAGLSVKKFQFTRPAWGATRGGAVRHGDVCVSIHAPRVGRDRTANGRDGIPRVSIHAPRVGRDACSASRKSRAAFQFTRPAWGATFHRDPQPYVGEVSIHAPRVGRDRGPRARA